jgi:hypothetical protein
LQRSGCGLTTTTVQTWPWADSLLNRGWPWLRNVSTSATPAKGEDYQLDAIADEINNRPRKGLGVRSPLSVYRELLANSQQHSMLIH